MPKAVEAVELDAMKHNQPRLVGVVCALLVAAALWLWFSAGAPRERHSPQAAARSETPVSVETRAVPSERAVPRAEADAAADSAPEPFAAKCGLSALASAEACVKDATPERGLEIFECLAALDLTSVGPTELAQWMCESDAGFYGVSRVVNECVCRRSPREAAPFLADLQRGCARFRETGLLTGTVAEAMSRSAAWHGEFVREFLQLDLVPEDGSQAYIQIAEQLIESGDQIVRAKLADIGRGMMGGDDGQLHRAALISLVTLPSDVERFEFLRSIVTTPSARGNELGNLLGEFLTSPNCWPSGEAAEALDLLSLALQDKRFARGVAAQLHGKEERGFPEREQPEWQRILDHARAIRGDG